MAALPEKKLDTLVILLDWQGHVSSRARSAVSSDDGTNRKRQTHLVDGYTQVAIDLF